MKTRILLVDDDPFILEMLKVSMTALGHAFDTAMDGEAAKGKLKEGEFSMVLTDLTMPRCDGMQLLKHVKAEYPQVEVIVITGHAETHGYTDVIRAGASDFITKPFGMDELEAKISRVIREQTLIRKLEHLSMCDMLTDLYNRRCFELKLHEEVPRAHRQGYPVFLVLLDVDRFKEYNDEYGHQAGDRVLHDIGRILVQCTRENVDWCFRFGGDEFAIIIPYANAAQVGLVADRIQERYGHEARYGVTSLTIGLAQFFRRPDTSWPEDIADLVARADKALYSGKAQGGNRVIVDASSPCPDEVVGREIP
ncbi:GGDEF domain-containing response regulator [Thiovibrio frasassiensis]|uniref:diguanylate cyclase n=1 Tax=Thiovibrio frasassiensis TaxID=2984131 RepID=A0A9X4MFS9_9BACT|nr:diguanylate cyclase [Thiovibrio frasassiensis]MDG4475578.1 diguanylate cyclase [Thiovibrio frasassiensis]